jgi:hypothetical protein
MRTLTVCLLALLPLFLLAKPVEEKSKPLKIDSSYASNSSPTTQPPVVQTEIIPHQRHPDGEPTFEEEIARVIEGSVENLIPFGASEKSQVVKKESATEEQPQNEGNVTGLSVVDWFGMVFNHDLGNQTSTPIEETTTTTIEPSHDSNLEWLQMILNHQCLMSQPQENQMGQQVNMQQEQNDDLVEDNVQEEVAPSSVFASKYQQWQNARNLATQQWIPSEPQKQDQYASAVKSKLSWSKLLAEPVEDYKRYTPADNTVQWSSGELNSEMIDNSQKQLFIPSAIMKNKQQWFDESEM